MSERYMPCALRTFRRTWGLTLREMADLLGYVSAAHVSRIERGKCIPPLEVALICTVLFGVPLERLFPQFVAESMDRFAIRATHLREELAHTTTARNLRKYDLLRRSQVGGIHDNGAGI